MVDIVKKSLLFGLGTYELSREKLQEFADKLSKEEKITPEEGKKLVEQVMKDTKKESVQYREQLRKIVHEILDELGVATKQDIESLKSSMTK